MSNHTIDTGLRTVHVLAATIGSVLFFCLATISPCSLCEQQSRMFADQTTVFKVYLSFHFILRNTETDDLQYHNLSAKNNLVLEQPFLISNPEVLERTI